jgi:hypothetical protein
MKRAELVRQLTEADCVLHRHGANHDIYLNPATGRKQLIPRHTEIDDAFGKHIERHLGLMDGHPLKANKTIPYRIHPIDTYLFL